jgi:hypothetical protein
MTRRTTLALRLAPLLLILAPLLLLSVGVRREPTAAYLLGLRDTPPARLVLGLEVADAGGKASTLSNGVLQHTFRTTSYTAPSNTYAGLFGTCPTTGNNGTELSGSGYARSSGIAKGDASWNYTAATFIGASTIKNAATISYPAASGAPWTVNCFGLWDASTAGNLLMWGSVTGAPVTVSVGATASFAVDQMTLTEN